MQVPSYLFGEFHSQTPDLQRVFERSAYIRAGLTSTQLVCSTSARPLLNVQGTHCDCMERK